MIFLIRKLYNTITCNQQIEINTKEVEKAFFKKCKYCNNIIKEFKCETCGATNE